jgi:hypothetical protein
MEIIKVDNENASEIIEKREPIGKFYTISKNNNGKCYVGIDNYHGDAWTEDFKSLASCKRWLIGSGEI